jgi:protein associated with RNAse G/E
MELTLKIRGIYATALTKFFLDRDVNVVWPSDAIAKRFGIPEKTAFGAPIGVEICDLEDGQGIVLKGPPGQTSPVVDLIREALFDAVCRKATNAQDGDVAVEFPYLAKSTLDEIRNSIVPTVINHHRLRIIASEFVDLMEKKTLSAHPEKRGLISRNLENSLIWKTYDKGKKIGIEHAKLNGRVISLSEGEIVEVDPKEKKLMLRRSKFSGRASYDGLNIPKREGDYAISEAKEGLWFYKHIYFRREGQVIGAYYNINTLIEFYPDKIRYVDLEMDVVRWPDGTVEVIDEEELNRQFKYGYLSEELKDVTIRTAHELKKAIFIVRENSSLT